jgi:hypothetical protein
MATPINELTTSDQSCILRESVFGGSKLVGTRRQSNGYDIPKFDLAASRSDPLAISISALAQPPPFVQRADKVSASYLVTYPNGSFVTTSTNTNAKVVSSLGTTVQVPFLLTNASSGIWSAIWVPSFSENLTQYHFEIDPANFSDAHGNLGVGQPVISSSFRLTTAKLALNISALSPLARREPEIISVPATYNGSLLQNITKLIANIVEPNATAYPLNLTLNGALLTGNFETTADAHLGTWQVNADFADAYGNTGMGALQFQVVKTTFMISPTYAQQVQRTLTLNVTANVSYLDNLPLTSGVDGNITIGNFTQSLKMTYTSGSRSWFGTFYVAQNATLGNYSLTLRAADQFGNSGNFTALVSVIPAQFIILVPTQAVQVNPLQVIDIVASVSYPNGTRLTDQVGFVDALYKNSTGGISEMLLEYNSTDGRWHTLFLAPDQRFKLFATTIIFSFEARDVYGNYGFASDLYSMTVTTPARLLILAAVAGIMIPVVLLGWAVFTVTKKRRQHKP